MATLLAMPGVMISLYYLHLFDSWCFFYEFRSIKGTELTAAGVGLAGGVIAFLLMKKAKLKKFLFVGVIVVMSLGIVLPYLKPILAPLDLKELNDTWDGRVCKQSTPSTCGAACAATILKHFGQNVSEKTIAKECFSTGSGTENWYIARALRKRGFNVDFHTKKTSKGIPVPCIAGVKIGRVGHFITILEDQGDSYLTGDPLEGERIFFKKDIENKYHFTGFFMVIKTD